MRKRGQPAKDGGYTGRRSRRTYRSDPGQRSSLLIVTRWRKTVQPLFATREEALPGELQRLRQMQKREKIFSTTSNPRALSRRTSQSFSPFWSRMLDRLLFSSESDTGRFFPVNFILYTISLFLSELYRGNNIARDCFPFWVKQIR
jgi:hypothetical protein